MQPSVYQHPEEPDLFSIYVTDDTGRHHVGNVYREADEMDTTTGYTALRRFDMGSDPPYAEVGKYPTLLAALQDLVHWHVIEIHITQPTV